MGTVGTVGRTGRRRTVGRKAWRQVGAGVCRTGWVVDGGGWGEGWVSACHSYVPPLYTWETIQGLEEDLEGELAALSMSILTT